MSIVTTVVRFLKQPSTLRGIIGVVTAAGVTLTPGQTEGIIAFALAGLALVELFRDEDKPKADK